MKTSLETEEKTERRNLCDHNKLISRRRRHHVVQTRALFDNSMRRLTHFLSSSSLTTDFDKTWSINTFLGSIVLIRDYRFETIKNIHLFKKKRRVAAFWEHINMCVEGWGTRAY